MINKIIKRTFAFLISLSMVCSFVGCSKAEQIQSSNDTEVIVIEETVYESDNMTTESTENEVQSSQTSEVESAPQSSEQTTVSSEISSTGSTVSEQEETVNTDYDWKSHPEDFKLLAFTFDDGPTVKSSQWVELFSAFEGAGTFFVIGTNLKSDADYSLLQNAINAGWDIGNHGANHLVATTGGNGGAATYEQMKADISDFSNELSLHLANTDGTPYKISLYRPPNIKPTDITFRVCGEDNLAVIWLSQDSYDWSSAKTEQHVYDIFKNGINTWQDGDIILSHEWSDKSYNALQTLLPDFYRAGYRFCSITELMAFRGISLDQVSGELNNSAQNNGMVTNIIEAANFGKK